MKLCHRFFSRVAGIRIRKESVSVVCLTLVFAFILAGCSRETGPVSGNREKPVIALIMKSLANEFFTTMAEGAKSHHQQHADDYDLIVNGIKDERDVDQQVSLVEQMIAKQVDAIVIAPADSKALVPICKRAVGDGITVINIDNKFDAGVLESNRVKIPFVGPDNREGARKVGEVLVAKLKPGDKVAILEGIPTAFNSQQRRLGFEEAVKAGKLEVVSVQSGEWEMAKANTITSAILSEHRDLSGLLCCNDNMALGALAAVKDAGLTGKILIVGFDNISAMRQLIKNGSVLATADQHADRLAVFGIEYALQILKERIVPKDKKTPVDLVTKETLK